MIDIIVTIITVGFVIGVLSTTMFLFDILEPKQVSESDRKLAYKEYKK